MIGATGSGKSTLIDAMINYITDVSWDDDYRFSIIDLTDDERDKQGKQVRNYKLVLFEKGNLKKNF